MPCDDHDPAERTHRLASIFLRRWLAETHTLVEPGALRVEIGPLRLRTEVAYRSPSGAHGFGAIHVLDSSENPVAVAGPALLAAACSEDARARAVSDAPINAPDAGSPVAGVLRAAGSPETGPEAAEAEPAMRADGPAGPAEAERWWNAHIEERLIPGVRELDSQVGSAEQATVSLLTRCSLALAGVLGRRGLADETDLLATLARRLRETAQAHPETEWLVRHWLTSPTLSDLALLNGSAVRYRPDSAGIRPRPIRFEVPNPLYAEKPGVPGVPVPDLGSDWVVRPVEIDSDADVDLVHRWMHTEHVAITWDQAWSWQRWRRHLANQLDGAHSLPCIVSSGGRQVAYVEFYRVLRDILGACYPYDPRDLGVHIAIGEPDAIGRGFGSSLLRAVAEGLLAADPASRRVVAEPSVHNRASIRAFEKAGYVRGREVGLPDKNSALLIFDR